MTDVAARLVAWGTGRTDLGGTTAAGVAALRAGVHWAVARADTNPSSGCLPRCAPVAFAVPLVDMPLASASCCRATHRHPDAIAAVIAQNLLGARLVRGQSWADAVSAVRSAPRAPGLERSWAGILASWSPGTAAGEGAPAVLAEAFCCVNAAADAESALIATVSFGGDTDTRGAVAGFLAGARWGFSGFSSRWVEGCPAAAEAIGIGRKLATSDFALDSAQLPGGTAAR